MAYVAVSRGDYDAKLFTDSREKLGAALGHDVSHTSALAPEVEQQQAAKVQYQASGQLGPFMNSPPDSKCTPDDGAATLGNSVLWRVGVPAAPCMSNKSCLTPASLWSMLAPHP